MVVESKAMEWGTRSVEGGYRSRLRCGRLLVEVSRGEDGVCLASKTLDDDEVGDEVGDEVDRDTAVAWTSWAVCTGSYGVRVLPSLPDLPVLANQEPVFEVLPGGEAKVFLRVPVFVEMRMTDAYDQLLAEFPTEALPRERFGEGDLEELCYRIASSASREILDDLDSAGVQAPILIRNESREVLRVTQICLRVAPLSIFRSGNSFWTSETLVQYQGGISPSRISVKGGTPIDAPNARLVVGPRDPSPPSRVGRTFRSFRRWRTGRA